MATTRDDLRRMAERGIEQGATHMIVKVDWFDYTDYPVYVMPNEDVREVEAKHSDRTMEVYSFTGNHTLDEQLAADRVFNYD